MRKEAEEHKEEDAKRKEAADTKNEAEQLVFQTEKSLKDLGDKVTESEKEEAEALIKDFKEALEKDDIEEIKEKKDKLQEKAMALATKVYEQVQKEQAANASSDDTTSSSDDDNVKEAEFEEK